MHKENSESRGNGIKEICVDQKVRLVLFNRTGTVIEIISGARAGEAKSYKVLLDLPLVEGDSNSRYVMAKYDQLEKIN